MQILLLIFILNFTNIFSQKLWENFLNTENTIYEVIDVPDTDYFIISFVSDDVEIRDKNTGKIIKNIYMFDRGQGNIRTSKNGEIYCRKYYGFPNVDGIDELEIRYLFNGKIKYKQIISIDSLEFDKDYNSKFLSFLNFMENGTKLFLQVSYNLGYNKQVYYYIIYNLETNELEDIISKKNEANIFNIYLSPDEKYIIEIEKGEQIARLLDIKSKTYTRIFYARDNNYEYDKVNALVYGSFQNDTLLLYSNYSELIFYKFPEMEVIKKINMLVMHNVRIDPSNQLKLCGEYLTTNVVEKIENTSSSFYQYFIKYNVEKERIEFSSKELQKSLDFSLIYNIDNCNKLLVVKDYDNRNSILACYDNNILDIKEKVKSSKYFTNTNSTINFNSQEFIGQIANLDIYNSTGIKLNTLHRGIINQTNYNFNLPELPSGAYYFQCQTANQNLNFNFVVVR